MRVSDSLWSSSVFILPPSTALLKSSRRFRAFQNMSSPPVAARAVQSDSSIGQGSVCAALSTWSFGALAVEECVPYLLNGCSALDAVEKGINKVSYYSSSTSSIINNSHM